MKAKPSLSENIIGILRRLEEIEAEIRDIRKRMDRLETTDASRTNSPITTDDLLRLPDALRKTMIAITQLQEATAEAVAKQTDRTRGMESIYLNQLTRMGYLEKIKRAKRIYFRTLRII